jgi:hypothetical protein
MDCPIIFSNENNLFFYFTLPYLFSNKFKTKFKEDAGAKLNAAQTRDTAKVATMDQYRFISNELILLS